ncbi:hypothetical protein ACFFGH_09825 [Lysobacter korlensis]|uniref:Uncharacterized protein n=1 Tax=Lysobacter korlensis TaxID=553636 RepID=A0ABV6RMC6_9GAMM
MPEWHPVSLLQQTGPNEWTMRSTRSMDTSLGRVHRIEFGLFREVWFRATVTGDGGPEVIGYARTAEAAAEAIWRQPRQDSHTRPHTGYPGLGRG